MKGIIFNLLEGVVEKQFGEQAWDDLLEKAGLEGVYTSVGNYPDAELVKLVAAAATTLDKSAEDVIRWFGVSAIPLLAEKYPGFFRPHDGTRSFLLTLNDIIHPEVRKLYPNADVPDFGYEIDPLRPEQLVMIYQSPRKLCVLAEGFIQGAAAHYGEDVTLRQTECMNNGASRCVIQLSFHRRIVK